MLQLKLKRRAISIIHFTDINVHGNALQVVLEEFQLL
jgi:hypothetical protein